LADSRDHRPGISRNLEEDLRSDITPAANAATS